jgi:hypothetical protein
VAAVARPGAGRGLSLHGAVLAAAFAVAALCTASAQASPAMRVGIYDEAQTLYGPAAETFASFAALHVQEVRVNLYWGGKHGVARRKPAHPTDPSDRAYDWTLYDRTVDYASQKGMQVLFSIYGTPPWANGGQSPSVSPRFGIDLRNFAYAAARRYSGTYPGPDGRILPAVREWLAWNEPNNPTFLKPQYKRVAGEWVVQSAVNYAKICNAIYSGIHGAGVARERVACGGTAPRGNNNPSSTRASVSPVAFLRAAKTAGLQHFDAWAHNPYYATPNDQPATKPVTAKGGPPTAVTLGNINTLISVLTTLYGYKPVWITEYGYQTNPPDVVWGVTPAKQAIYLTQAFGIARANPRIQMMLWFLLRDEARLSGWQSGLVTYDGKHKPSYAAFSRMGAAAAR